ncbi:MAG: PadR family transcriptional regulator [Cohaesibacteraceae bacterium]|nr:PadR family transcriptional regulator [Cohaesibacteraceae bacterium]
MNVRTLCLAILYFGDATGYEIKKLSMEGKYSHFVDASFGSIYPALNRLESAELVTCREEIQPGKPARKVYSITEAGKQEFLKALSEPPKEDVFRSEFLLIAICAEIVGPEHISRALDIRMDQLRKDIEHFRTMLDGQIQGATKWTIKYGLTCFEASLAYLENERHELEQIAASATREAAE